MLELMARGGMRIGEVLKITSRDVEDFSGLQVSQASDISSMTCKILLRETFGYVVSEFI
jgi:hypothetical protein